MIFIKRAVLMTAIVMLIFLIPVQAVAGAAGESLYGEMPVDVSPERLSQVDRLIAEKMQQGKLPGLAMIITLGEKAVYEKYFGYADREKRIPVGPGTLFEMGSNSKAFTGLGLLLLRDEGRLRLEDPVKLYLPWFKVYYGGKEAQLTISQLLYQNSGIPPNALGKIKPSAADSSLEEAVKALSGIRLDFKPGSRYTYSTVNYDVLGLIIQTAAGMPYETYMKERVFTPLGLDNTYILRTEAEKHELARGYKYGFLSARAYDYPQYRGNAPASMVISCARDMGRWLMLQNGAITVPGFNQALLEESHVPNRAVSPTPYSSSYAMGWHVYQSGAGELVHMGSNATFFSELIFRPREKLGIAAMSNINSYAVRDIAEVTSDKLLDRRERPFATETNRDFDKVCTALFIMSAAFGLVFLAYLCSILVQLLKSERRFSGFTLKRIFKLIFSFAVVFGFYEVLNNLHEVIPQFRKYPWDYIGVWGPSSTIPAVIGLFAAGMLFYMQFMLEQFFPPQKGKRFFNLVSLSIASGFGNSFLIFVINTAVANYRAYDPTSGEYEYPVYLLLYFTMGIIVYLYGQRILRARMLTLVNELVYETRRDLIGKLLSTGFARFEKLERGKAEACLNNDTETVSKFAGTLVFFTTSIVTVLCCFVYLGFLNIYGFLLTFGAVALCGGAYVRSGRKAGKLWEKTRDIQNLFFKYIGSLTGGFKELRINGRARAAFAGDINAVLADYRQKRTAGDLGFAYVFVFGELLFTLVIGFAALTFPVVFKGLSADTLASFVFIFLYMSGPVTGVLNTIPDVTQASICWKRIKAFKDEIYQEDSTFQADSHCGQPELKTSVRLKKVTYTYRGQEDGEFTLGPVDWEFRKGQLTFVTGGNGSGKSTLAKLLTGLYVPGEGSIEVDERKVSPEELGNYFAVVFSDFYLFEKLYGINSAEKQQEIEYFLKVLKLEDKVGVSNGAFSTTRLSTGQRKRLALLLAQVEDKPVCLFDEWAADQDPEYRRFFYEILLPEMKKKGKCIIAITHDDRYFHLADRLLKLEFGQVANEPVLNMQKE